VMLREKEPSHPIPLYEEKKRTPSGPLKKKKLIGGEGATSGSRTETGTKSSAVGRGTKQHEGPMMAVERIERA